MRRNRGIASLVLMMVLATGQRADCEPTGFPVAVVRTIPQSEAELAAAFNANAPYTCQQVAPGQPLEVTDFRELFVYRWPAQSRGAPEMRLQASRLGILTFGLDMTPEDQQNLPFLSGGQILDRVSGEYIAIQVRLIRESPEQDWYLHHQPAAFVGTFGDVQATGEFADMMTSAVSEVRGIGLYVRPSIDVAPETLRTVVAVHRNLPSDRIEGSPEGDKPSYELVFVRARATDDGTASGKVTLHTFATSDQRQRLQYFKPATTPAKPDQCSIKSTIYFTAYGFAGLVPAAKATRKIEIQTQATFSFGDLDQFAAAQHLQGAALDNLTEVLDAIIDGKLAPPR